MSKGTEALDTAMELHQDNTLACQAANTQKANCDANLAASARQVAEAITAVQTEANSLTSQAAAVIDQVKPA